jgi:uronate dehydrogenase
MMRVLITGAAGYIGRRLSRGLENDFDLRLGDLHVPENDPRWVRLDVTNPSNTAAVVRDVDAVVHLAVASGHEGDYEDSAFNQLRFDVNVKGTWNVLEAARRASVRRFVFTSSLMVVWGFAPPEWVAGDAPPRPVGTYAVTKQLGEELCRHYAQSFGPKKGTVPLSSKGQSPCSDGLSVVCLRIPKPIDLADAAWKQRPIRPQWLAFPDLIEAYRRALLAPGIGFEIVTVVGDCSRRRWDLSRAEKLLGYRPTLRLEELGYQLGDEREPV